MRLLGDLGRSWIFHNLFTIFGVFALLCIRRTFLGAVAGPRQHPAAFVGVRWPREGGEAARRGESFRHCERQRRPGASAGRCDGLLMAFAFLFYHIILLHLLLHLLLCGGILFVERCDFLWSGGHQGVLGSSGTRVVWLKLIGDAETQHCLRQRTQHGTRSQWMETH